MVRAAGCQSSEGFPFGFPTEGHLLQPSGAGTLIYEFRAAEISKPAASISIASATDQPAARRDPDAVRGKDSVVSRVGAAGIEELFRNLARAAARANDRALGACGGEVEDGIASVTLVWR